MKIKWWLYDYIIELESQIECAKIESKKAKKLDEKNYYLGMYDAYTYAYNYIIDAIGYGNFKKYEEKLNKKMSNIIKRFAKST